MPRLPVPGSDNGQWGDLLNAFLLVEHNNDGSLKTPAIPQTDLGTAGGVATLDGSGKIPTSQLPSAAIAGDASPTQKGIIQLAGDLDNTASIPRIANGAITDAKIASNASIAQSKIADLSTDLSGKVSKAGDTMTGDLLFAKSGSTAIGTFNAQDLKIYTNNSEIARFDTSGQLGIGTTPQRMFHVRGSNALWRLDRNQNTAGMQIHVFDGAWTAPLKGFLIGVDSDGVNSGLFKIADYGQATSGTATTRFVIDNSGNIRVGSAATTSNGLLNLGGDTTAAANGMYFGTDTNLYRSAAGTLKTDGSIQLAGTGNSYLIGGIFAIGQTSGSAKIDATAGTVPTLRLRQSGSSNYFEIFNSTVQLAIDNTYKLVWSGDTNLYRSAADTLRTDDNLMVGGTGNFTSTLSYPVAQTYRSSVTTVFQARAALADTVDRFVIASDGGLAWGSGSGATDAYLYRRVAGVLSTGSGNDLMDIGAGGFVARRVNTTDNALVAKLYTDATARLYISASGQISWADGAGAADTNLYRSAADTLKTDDAFIAGAGITPRVNTLTVSANTYTPAANTTDIALITSPTAGFTVANPTGTPVDGQKLTFRIKSGATGYTPTWGTNYQSSGVATLPNYALPASKTVTLGFTYDSAAAKWTLLAADIVGY